MPIPPKAHLSTTKGNDAMTIRELQYAIQHAIDVHGVPDHSEAIAKEENGKVTFYAVIKNVQFKNGTIHTINFPLH